MIGKGTTSVVPHYDMAIAALSRRFAVKPTRMMSPPGTYFVTFATWQRRRLFVVESSECVGIPLGSAFKGFRLDERTSAAKADVA